MGPENRMSFLAHPLRHVHAQLRWLESLAVQRTFDRSSDSELDVEGKLRRLVRGKADAVSRELRLCLRESFSSLNSREYTSHGHPSFLTVGQPPAISMHLPP